LRPRLTELQVELSKDSFGNGIRRDDLQIGSVASAEIISILGKAYSR
jgi:hypothetical protein